MLLASPFLVRTDLRTVIRRPLRRGPLLLLNLQPTFCVLDGSSPAQRLPPCEPLSLQGWHEDVGLWLPLSFCIFGSLVIDTVCS